MHLVPQLSKAIKRIPLEADQTVASGLKGGGLNAFLGYFTSQSIPIPSEREPQGWKGEHLLLRSPKNNVPW